MATKTNGWQQAIYSKTKALGGLEVKVDRLEGKLEQLQETKDQYLQQIDQRFTQLENRFDKVEERLTKVEQKLDTIQGIGVAILLGIIVNIFYQPILNTLKLG